jgi:CubicO group peptidase (beta-lactamase class C family)
LVGLCLFLTALPILAAENGQVGSDRSAVANDTSEKLKSRFDEVCRDRKFMGAALITVNGRAVFSAACGWADAQWNVENTTDTRFLIGSITKEFTAAAVLLLYQEKRIALSDPIGHYLPNLPSSWQTATIHQLLTHTSGIPIYTASADGKRTNPDINRLVLDGDIPNQLLDLARDRPCYTPTAKSSRTTTPDTFCWAC